MGFSRKHTKTKEIDELVEELSETLDGFLLIGYRKGDHKKVVIEKGNDPACRDALSFFKAVIQAWASMGPNNEGEPDIE